MYKLRHLRSTSTVKLSTRSKRSSTQRSTIDAGTANSCTLSVGPDMKVQMKKHLSCWLMSSDMHLSSFTTFISDTQTSPDLPLLNCVENKNLDINENYTKYRRGSSFLLYFLSTPLPTPLLLTHLRSPPSLLPTPATPFPPLLLPIPSTLSPLVLSVLLLPMPSTSLLPYMLLLTSSTHYTSWH